MRRKQRLLSQNRGRARWSILSRRRKIHATLIQSWGGRTTRDGKQQEKTKQIRDIKKEKAKKWKSSSGKGEVFRADVQSSRGRFSKGGQNSKLCTQLSPGFKAEGVGGVTQKTQRKERSCHMIDDGIGAPVCSQLAVLGRCRGTQHLFLLVNTRMMLTVGQH